MKIFLLVLLAFFIFRLYFFALENNKRSSLTKYSSSISDWMNMGRQNRRKLDQKHKLYIMHKKKDLTDKIRKEYINYKKSLIK